MKSILMVTLSRHASFQDGVFSMYHQLKDRYKVWTITRKNDDYPAPHEENNYFVEAPENPGLSKETFNLGEWSRMMKIIKELKPEIVYLESFHVWNYPIMLYCKRKSITLACSLNDVILHPGDSHIGIKKMFNASQVIMADRVVMRSKNGLENAQHKYPKHMGKMYCTDLWYTFPNYCAPRGNYVLFFGRMNRYKGIDNLYELIKMTSELDYVVAGKADDSDMDTINKIGALPNVKLENRIIPYNDMHEYFYGARCIVLPYQSATQSGVILDATKHSRPAVAFRVGALGEQIIDGKTGLLAQPGNVQELAEKVRSIVRMGDREYEDMCQNAYEFGLQKYSAQGQEDNFMKSIGAIGVEGETGK